jgi:integrase
LLHLSSFFGVMRDNVFMNTSSEYLYFNDFARSVISTLPIRQKTRSTYLSAFTRHIEPALRLKTVQEVSRADVQRVIAPLSPQLAATTLAVLKTLYREGIAGEIISTSPAHGVSGPRIFVSPRKFLTWEELAALEFGKYTAQIHFLALHGLRWGEAVVLTGDDVRDGRIYVSRSIHGQTKSKAAVRMVPLIGKFTPIPRSPKTLRKVLEPHGVTIHSLRHSFAYLLKQQGVHVTTAQRLLGHSDPRVTLAIYTQVLDNEIDDVGKLINSVINP